MEKFSFKEVYDGLLITNTEIQIGDKIFNPNEVVLRFDDIKELTLSEQVVRRNSQGGWNNASLVNWETTQEGQGALSCGTISKLGLAVLNKTNLVQKSPKILLNKAEELETDGTGTCTLKFTPNPGQLKIYLWEEGEKVSEILDYSLAGTTLKIGNVYSNILVEYWFYYENPVEVISIGKKDLNGYFTFIGKFQYANENTSEQKTGIIEIPKIRILSNFQVVLGRNTNPFISNLYFQIVPFGDRHDSKLINLLYLDENIQ